MKGVTDIIAIGLAHLYTKGTKQDPMEVLKQWASIAQAMESPSVELDQSTQDDIDAVYQAYPTRDVYNGNRPTGKSASDKRKIASLLRKHTKDDLIGIINTYIVDCASSHVYIKNFSTFLNNLPDYSPEKKAEDSYWQ